MFDAQLLLQALDEAADFIVVTDDTPVDRGGPLVEYANRSFLEATGFSRDDLVGSSFERFYSPKNPHRVRDSIARALATREPNAKEMLALRKDGSEFWMEFVAKPFWQRGGREYWLSIGRDISTRRRALSQMALLFAAIEHTADAVSLYEPADDGTLALTYENEESVRAGDGRLLDLWNSSSERAQSIRSRLEKGTEIHEYFAEPDRNGRPRVVQFNARAIRSDSRLEGIVALERTIASAGDHTNEHYGSVLLRIAAMLPSLASATTANERFAMLRAILLDAFDAELYESDAPLPESVHIAAGANLARFTLDGKSMIVRWGNALESTALTAMRFCIEAAIEQARLPHVRRPEATE